MDPPKILRLRPQKQGYQRGRTQGSPIGGVGEWCDNMFLRGVKISNISQPRRPCSTSQTRKVPQGNGGEGSSIGHGTEGCSVITHSLERAKAERLRGPSETSWDGWPEEGPTQDDPPGKRDTRTKDSESRAGGSSWGSAGRAALGAGTVLCPLCPYWGILSYWGTG